jgi:molybdopterin converting factor small subunit
VVDPALESSESSTIKSHLLFEAVVQVAVLLFARLKELVGSAVVTLTIPSAGTVADIRKALGDAYPQTQPLLAHLLIAVDKEYAAPDTRVLPTSEVVCFPPVSGG